MASNLRRLFRGLEALYCTDSGIDPHDHLVEFDGGGEQQEVVVLREAEDGVLEVGLALDRDTLAEVEALDPEAAFDDDHLGRTLPVLEGLSHLLYLAEAARCERPVSGLELETQAEVDKLAVCLLARWPDAADHFAPLVDRLYHRFELTGFGAANRDRYHTANRVAVGFSRQLWPVVDSGRIDGLRGQLRRFWSAPMSRKRRLAT